MQPVESQRLRATRRAPSPHSRRAAWRTPWPARRLPNDHRIRNSDVSRETACISALQARRRRGSSGRGGPRCMVCNRGRYHADFQPMVCIIEIAPRSATTRPPQVGVVAASARSVVTSGATHRPRGATRHAMGRRGPGGGVGRGPSGGVDRGLALRGLRPAAAPLRERARCAPPAGRRLIRAIGASLIRSNGCKRVVHANTRRVRRRAWVASPAPAAARRSSTHADCGTDEFAAAR